MARKRARGRVAREAVNWVVQSCGPTMAKAIAPGGDTEWVFDGRADPLGDAIEFAAAKLRGE
ncbi:hypothetical protein PHELEMICH_70 [Mycobacterium phage Phelemich]|uniref:Uncharacterized protein n=2 Tax=Acadianvirus reprobate TaxID=1982903 RepID=S5Y1D2_9CAUD|nr:hypothetical protein N847_gp70 [Mycobacterium phage Phelemich]YP_008409993.1 hypothetical protein REPROBATE_72 [Mycobacterium phage Reprobate]AGT12808.1 hypothetical protein REPROBATE_72 [Mycobacterium phage Reprobate]AGT13984.1 hypothetical protein PHELEMICH_70 [Mycobacterium phage Phelemich]